MAARTDDTVLAGVGIEARVVLCRPNNHPRMLIVFRKKDIEISLFWGWTEWNKFQELMEPVLQDYKRMKEIKPRGMLKDDDLEAFM